jgi:hypothetical protein
MPLSSNKPHPLTKAQARRIWLHAQRLDISAPFGDGPEATRAAVEDLGYVQIDTINVIERCHHHILQTRLSIRSGKSLGSKECVVADAVVIEPVSILNFPANGRRTGNLAISGTFSASDQHERPVISGLFVRIPYSKEQGISSAEQGISSWYQGISVANFANVRK